MRAGEPGTRERGAVVAGFEVRPEQLVDAAGQLADAAAPVTAATSPVCGGADPGHAGLSAALSSFDAAWSAACGLLGADLVEAGTRLVLTAADYAEADSAVGGRFSGLGAGGTGGAP